MTLAHAQCWILLANFETRNLWFSRASLSVGRSVRLAQMLGLHNIEGLDDRWMTMVPPTNWKETEERRRTLWMIFCNDRLASSTTGCPVLMDAKLVSVNTFISTVLPL
jgi:hypothetical protein